MENLLRNPHEVRLPERLILHAMKRKNKIIIATVLGITLYCVAYLAHRHYGIRYCSSRAVHPSVVEKMTDTEYQATVLDYWARKPVPYFSGIAGGLLYWSFLPARTLDRLITGRESEYDGLFLKPYDIPKPKEIHNNPMQTISH